MSTPPVNQDKNVMNDSSVSWYHVTDIVDSKCMQCDILRHTSVIGCSVFSIIKGGFNSFYSGRGVFSSLRV